MLNPFAKTASERVAAALAGFSAVKAELQKGIAEILDRRAEIHVQLTELSDETARLIAVEVKAGKAIRALDALIGD